MSSRSLLFMLLLSLGGAHATVWGAALHPGNRCRLSNGGSALGSIELRNESETWVRVVCPLAAGRGPNATSRIVVHVSDRSQSESVSCQVASTDPITGAAASSEFVSTESRFMGRARLELRLDAVFGRAATLHCRLPGKGAGPSAVIGYETIELHRAHEIRLLFLNAYLMRRPPPGAEKPAVGDRARRIGEVIRQEFDVAVLAEVWTDEELGDVLSAWPEGKRPQVVDAISRAKRRSSGLVTVVNYREPVVSRSIGGSYNLIRTAFHHFSAEGSLPDRLASKGVLMATLDVGLGGKLEIFSTHLVSGKGNKSDRINQLAEVASFFKEHHDPRNVALLVGDLNIDAHGDCASGGAPICDEPFTWPGILDAHELALRTFAPDPQRLTQYGHLTRFSDFLGLEDLWATRNGTPGYTCCMDCPAIAEAVCVPDPTDGSVCLDGEETFTELFTCVELPFLDGALDVHKAARRIDYMFLEKPTDEHRIVIEADTPRRSRFERRLDAPQREHIGFLSDHLGLEVMLKISSKSP